MNALTKSTFGAPVLQPSSFGELVQFAKMASESDLMPKDYRGKPANIMLAVQMGSEVGLSPMQAIQNISVINGRPGLWGDAMLGLARRSPLCEDVAETIEGDGDARVAVCIVRRAGASPVTRRFSVADAKRAGLWSKPGPWQQYPDRMLQMRARGFALRDAFPDVLRGLNSAEELTDMPSAEPPHRGPTLDGHAEPVSAPTTAEALNDSIPVLDEEPVKAVPRPTLRDMLRSDLAAAASAAEVLKVADRPQVQRALKEAPPAVRDEIQEMLAEAYGRFQAPADDDLAGLEEEPVA